MAFAKHLVYPDFRRDKSLFYVIHGQRIDDFFGWLENLASEETIKFVNQQMELAERILGECETRVKFKEKLMEATNGIYTHVLKQGGKTFLFYSHVELEQDLLCIQDTFDQVPRVLVDPTKYGANGTASFHNHAVSKDGKYVAFGLCEKGSDWQVIRVIGTGDEKLKGGALYWVHSTPIVWTRDSKGFFYSCYPRPDEGTSDHRKTHANYLNHELRYHFLGDDQSEDILCWKDPDNPRHAFLADTEKDKESEEDKALIGDPQCRQPEVITLDILGSSSDTCTTRKLYLSTLAGGLDAFRGRKELLPFDEDKTSFTSRTNNDVPRYMSEVKNDLQLRALGTGPLQYQKPPDIGTVSKISARRKDDVGFIGLTIPSFLAPRQRPPKSGEDDPNLAESDIVIKEVGVPGKIPLTIKIMCRRNALNPKEGPHPCLLIGYGGFKVEPSPFQPEHRVLVRHLGAIVCIANIRGDGGKVEDWHKEAILANKQNSIDDFHTVAKHLISMNYTEAKKLCIEGVSNGGLLVMACVNQRPDLYACALVTNGLMDMLQYHKFTIGHLWIPEYGCSEKKEDFGWLHKYSPLHNVRRPWIKSRDWQYPAIMFLVSDHDDRVMPWNTMKQAATMQHLLCTSYPNGTSPQTNPIIVRMERDAGHGHGFLARGKLIQQAADKYSFMAKMTGAEWIEKH